MNPNTEPSLKAALSENAILRAALYDIANAKPEEITVCGERFDAGKMAMAVLRYIGAEVPKK